MRGNNHIMKVIVKLFVIRFPGLGSRLDDLAHLQPNRLSRSLFETLNWFYCPCLQTKCYLIA